MKKYILLILKIVFVVMIVLGPINFLYQKTNYYKNANYEIVKIKNAPFEIELANFGSSHGQLGFFYNDNRNLDTFNFALSSQTPEYDLSLLKSNIKHFKKGAIVLFPISYFSMYLLPTEKDNEFEVRNTRYYSFLEARYIIKYDVFLDIQNQFKMLSKNDVLNFRRIWDDVPLMHELELPYGNFPLEEWKLNAYRIENFEQTALDRWNFWSTERANLSLENGNNLNKKMFDAYVEMAEFSKENGLIPVFLTLPVSKQLNDVIEPEFMKMFEHDVKELTDITNTTYLDYSHDTRFMYDLIYFLDTDHLNQSGAEFFTKVVLEDLDELNILHQ